MAFKNKCYKFFRFRTAGIKREGSPGEIWLFDGLKDIDYSWEDFMNESIIICRETRGGFTLDNIKELSFEEHNYVLKESERLQRESVSNG